MHNLVMPFFTLGSSKINVLKTCFRPYFCVVHLFLGIGRPGGAESPKGSVQQFLMQFFTLGSSKIEVSETYFLDIVVT